MARSQEENIFLSLLNMLICWTNDVMCPHSVENFQDYFPHTRNPETSAGNIESMKLYLEQKWRTFSFEFSSILFGSSLIRTCQNEIRILYTNPNFNKILPYSFIGLCPSNPNFSVNCNQLNSIANAAQHRFDESEYSRIVTISYRGTVTRRTIENNSKSGDNTCKLRTMMLESHTPLWDWCLTNLYNKQILSQTYCAASKNKRAKTEWPRRKIYENDRYQANAKWSERSNTNSQSQDALKLRN